MSQTPTASTNAIAWFEIPVRDIDRAQTFYATLLGAPLRREAMGANTLAVFPYSGSGVGGCLMAGADVVEPSSSGTLVFLDADNEIVAPALPPPTPLAALNPPPQTHQKLESARAFAQQNPAAVAQIVKDWVGTPPAPKAS